MIFSLFKIYLILNYIKLFFCYIIEQKINNNTESELDFFQTSLNIFNII